MSSGQVKHVFVQYPLDSLHPQARPAAEAALCAAKQSAQAFWDYHELLFEKVSEWSGQEDLTELLLGYANDLQLDTGAFQACVQSRETAEEVQAQVEDGAAKGVSGVPAFFINDWFVSGAQPFEAFQDVIERALRGEHPAPTPTPLPEGKTPFDVDPGRPGYTYGGDAYRGSAEAELALVAFIDFTSELNQAFVQETWPSIEKDYVDTDLVRLVIKHFPPADQPAAFQAALAAECAGQQNAFWELHDLLFEKQDEWSQADNVLLTFKGYAADLGLNEADFAACLDEKQTQEKVSVDQTIALQNGFPPAPQFFAFKGAQGGYIGVETLKDQIDELLAQ